MSRPLLRAVSATAVVGAATLAYGLYEAQKYTLRTASLPLLPSGSAPIRLLHVSDFHMLPSHSKMVAFLWELADLSPDMVIVTGDNLGHADAVPTVLDALLPLAKTPGAFVFGSNDYFAPRLPKPWKYFLEQGNSAPRTVTAKRLPTDKLRSGFTDFGWKDLNNASSELMVCGTRISLVGVDDPHLGYDDYAKATSERRDGDILIGLTHSPYTRVLDAMASDGTTLILSGHTHGGQVCLPGGRALITNCDLPREYASGVHTWHGADNAATVLNISAGLGCAPMAPIRIARPPEASLLTLTAARGGSDVITLPSPFGQPVTVLQ